MNPGTRTFGRKDLASLLLCMVGTYLRHVMSRHRRRCLVNRGSTERSEGDHGRAVKKVESGFIPDDVLIHRCASHNSALGDPDVPQFHRLSDSVTVG
ncbi:MAG: hypothetical protein K2H59_09960 [Muribaculaceae bacterium]|nr:hypothetical protein [Muribaculaceae bacterium]